MSIFEILGLGTPHGTHQRTDEAGDSLAPIIAQLRGLEPDRARFLAAFAVVLARAAQADLEVSEVEVARMTEVLADEGGLPLDQARLVAEVAANDTVRHGAEDYLGTREFKRISSHEERLRVLDCLFAVCAADDSVSVVEEEQVRQVATELGLEHADYIAARQKVSDKRDVMRGLRRQSQQDS